VKYNSTPDKWDSINPLLEIQRLECGRRNFQPSISIGKAMALELFLSLYHKMKRFWQLVTAMVLSACSPCLQPSTKSNDSCHQCANLPGTQGM
jgi:hypothetical protein